MKKGISRARCGIGEVKKRCDEVGRVIKKTAKVSVKSMITM
jgi:hypothetical protein